jgi:hypothetical protein
LQWLTPKQCASIIGKLRSAIQISPWGVYLSFALATNLKRACCNALSSQRSFWLKGKVRLNQAALRDICLLLETLLAPEEDPLWTRPIALLVPRKPTHWLKSDASYAGIGGWTLSFGTFMWRITREALVDFGFNMKTIGTMVDEPTDPNTQGLHINPLEFLAVIVNLWIAAAVTYPPLGTSSPCFPTTGQHFLGRTSPPLLLILNSSSLLVLRPHY